MSEYFDVELKCVNLAKIEEDFIPDGFGISCHVDNVSIAFNLSRKNENESTVSTQVYFSWKELKHVSLSHSGLLRLSLSRALKLLEN